MNYPGSVHGHSEYSNVKFRDAITRYNEMIQYANELNHEVLAITEHDCLSGMVKLEKLYEKNKKINPNLKIIRGNEIYLTRNDLTPNNIHEGDRFWHFILLAKDLVGFYQLCELSSRAWKRSYMHRGLRRVPTYYSDIEEIVGKNPGHLIASSACLGSYLDSLILKYKEIEEDFFNPSSKTKWEEIKNWCNYIQNIFRKENFYLELQPSGSQGWEQKYVNQKLIRLSKELDIPYIITTDTHYLKREEAPIHSAYLKSQSADREVASFYETTYMMSTEELEGFLNYLTREELDEAYRNILKIKRSCEDYTILKELKIPELSWKSPKVDNNNLVIKYSKVIPWFETFMKSDYHGDNLMVKLVAEKIESNPIYQKQEVYDELNINLQTTWESSIVNKTHWSAYFLNLQGIIDVCWDAGSLVGCGRGSGVGFLLLHMLDLIQIDKTRETTQLYSWRFLNPERESILDIDTDIEGSKRPQVLRALRKTYGEDRVANVVTFGKETSKSAIQTSARGLGIDNDEALYISSLIPADRGQIRSLKQCYYGDKEKDFKPVTLFVQEMNKNPELWEMSQKIENLICRVGEHAGGVIFVDEPFEKSTALMRVPNGDLVTQFDLHDDEAVS